MKTLAQLFQDMIVFANQCEKLMGKSAAAGSAVHQIYQFAAKGNLLLRNPIGAFTPAQRHADELVESLWVAANILRGGNLSAQEHERKIRALLAKLEPIEPPTLQEALDALMKLADGAGAVMAGTWDKDSMQPERTAAHDIIRRARAAGVLK